MNFPNILYHYTTQDGLLGITKSKELWASKIQYMNDQQEFLLMFDIAKEKLQKKLSNNSLNKEFIEEINHDIHYWGSLKNLNIFAMSLTSEKDCLELWRGYSPNNPGFAIGFDTRQLLSIARGNDFILDKCIYTQEEQNKYIDDKIEEKIKFKMENIAARF